MEIAGGLRRVGAHTSSSALTDLGLCVCVLVCAYVSVSVYVLGVGWWIHTIGCVVCMNVPFCLKNKRTNSRPKALVWSKCRISSYYIKITHCKSITKFISTFTISQVLYIVGWTRWDDQKDKETLLIAYQSEYYHKSNYRCVAFPYLPGNRLVCYYISKICTST